MATVQWTAILHARSQRRPHAMRPRGKRRLAAEQLGRALRQSAAAVIVPRLAEVTAQRRRESSSDIERDIAGALTRHASRRFPANGEVERCIRHSDHVGSRCMNVVKTEQRRESIDLTNPAFAVVARAAVGAAQVVVDVNMHAFMQQRVEDPRWTETRAGDSPRRLLSHRVEQRGMQGNDRGARLVSNRARPCNATAVFREAPNDVSPRESPREVPLVDKVVALVGPSAFKPITLICDDKAGITKIPGKSAFFCGMSRHFCNP